MNTLLNQDQYHRTLKRMETLLKMVGNENETDSAAKEFVELDQLSDAALILR